MHEAVRIYLRNFASEEECEVLDIGGRSVNGSAREFFPNARYTSLDIRPGEDVDIVADASTWDPGDRQWDVVLSTGTFEHTPVYPEILVTAYKACRPGGRLVVTCAGPGFSPHCAFQESQPLPGEFYENVTPEGLETALNKAGWQEIDVKRAFLDLFATARRPE